MENKIDFRNTKIDLSNNTEEERANFQRLAFENGCVWNGAGAIVRRIDKMYYYIGDKNKMTYSEISESKYFDMHINRQIFYTDLFPEVEKEAEPDLKETFEDMVKRLESEVNKTFSPFLIKCIAESNESELSMATIDKAVNDFMKSKEERIKELEESLELCIVALKSVYKHTGVINSNVLRQAQSLLNK